VGIATSTLPEVKWMVNPPGPFEARFMFADSVTLTDAPPASVPPTGVRATVPLPEPTSVNRDDQVIADPPELLRAKKGQEVGPEQLISSKQALPPGGLQTYMLPLLRLESGVTWTTR
jgi:hypothetical protein